MVDMGATTKTLLTWEEFERLPEREGKDELIDGELIELPPPKIKHSKGSKCIFKALDIALDLAHARGEAAHLGEVYHETGYRLGQRHWVVPDVSITHHGQPETDYLEDSPAIAIEVVSDSNTPKRIARKTKLYFQYGAREVWHCDRNPRKIEVHTPAGVRVVTQEQSVTTPLLPGFSLPVSAALPD
jgi:Uma2 family endonuclease